MASLHRLSMLFGYPIWIVCVLANLWRVSVVGLYGALRRQVWSDNSSLIFSCGVVGYYTFGSMAVFRIVRVSGLSPWRIYGKMFIFSLLIRIWAGCPLKKIRSVLVQFALSLHFASHSLMFLVWIIDDWSVLPGRQLTFHCEHVCKRLCVHIVVKYRSLVRPCSDMLHSHSWHRFLPTLRTHVFTSLNRILLGFYILS